MASFILSIRVKLSMSLCRSRFAETTLGALSDWKAGVHLTPTSSSFPAVHFFIIRRKRFSTISLAMPRPSTASVSLTSAGQQV